MGSLLDQLQKKSRVTIQISNPQIQQHQFAKMASFKILLVVALVAFIGSSDALKCMVKAGAGAAVSTDCAGKTSCKITAKITLNGAKPEGTAVTAQACDDRDLKEATKLFEPIPAEIVKDAVATFYCKDDDCNVDAEIKAAFKADSATTIAAMKKVNEDHKKAKKGTMGPDGKTAGAAQTTVAVATIAFSMAMARLAL